MIFGAKHSSPHSNEGEPFLTFCSSYSLTRKLNAQRETHFSAINLCDCFTKIVAAPLMSLHSFLSPCAHGPFFIFEINNIIPCALCASFYHALNFSLFPYLCGFVENEEVKYFAIIRWQAEAPSSGRVCVRVCGGSKCVCIDTARLAYCSRQIHPPWNAFGYLFSPAQVAQRCEHSFYTGICRARPLFHYVRSPTSERSMPDGGLNF